MPTKTTTKPAAKAKLASVGDTVKTKAKAAYTKGAAAFDDVKELTKGNVDAVVESGKILGAGLKTLGEGYVAEGKTAYATFNADFKELAAVKSPVDFFQLQSKIIGRNFGTAIDFHSKNAEAVIKLAKDSATPLTKRAALVVEKVRKAA